MNEIKILYADDEPRYRKLVKLFFKEAGYTLITVSNGLEALEHMYDNTSIDLIILDVMMPIMDGWETCKEIREFSNVPIIMLTALDDEHNEIYGIDNGADDYISKPFSHDLLNARVKSLLRRVNKNKDDLLSDEGFGFDETRNEILYDGHSIELRPKEYELLKALVMNKNIVLSREQILNKVWGFDYEGDRRTVDTHIKSLRSSLGQLGDRIVTLRGKGYCYRGEK